MSTIRQALRLFLACMCCIYVIFYKSDVFDDTVYKVFITDTGVLYIAILCFVDACLQYRSLNELSIIDVFNVILTFVCIPTTEFSGVVYTSVYDNCIKRMV